MDELLQNKAIARKWIEAFNTQNLPGLLALYANDAAHYSPKLLLREPATKGLITGKTALEEWWAGAFERLPSLRYELVNLIVDKQQLLMEYRRTVDGEAAMMVAEILEFRDGLICRSRVYHG